ncbi:MAG: ribosome maturation factor RimP, partial [Clostridiales bacterium]
MVYQWSEPIAQEQGCELVDVEFVKEGGQWILRIFLDKEPLVDHACCQAFSYAIDAVLEEKDPISQSYTLEVSSPGIERPLKKPEDFCRFADQTILVSLY